MPDIVKKTSIRSVQPQADGSLIVRIGLDVLEGDAILGGRTHDMPLIEPGDAISKHINHINQHIAEEGQRLPHPGGSGLLSETVVKYPPLTEEHITHLRKHADLHWTPELIGRWDGIRAKRQAEAEQAAREAEAPKKLLEPDGVILPPAA